MVDVNYMRKHLNDALRLSQLLAPATRITIGGKIADDRTRFLALVAVDSAIDPKALQLGSVTVTEQVDRIPQAYARDRVAQTGACVGVTTANRHAGSGPVNINRLSSDTRGSTPRGQVTSLRNRPGRSRRRGTGSAEGRSRRLDMRGHRRCPRCQLRRQPNTQFPGRGLREG